MEKKSTSRAISVASSTAAGTSIMAPMLGERLTLLSSRPSMASRIFFRASLSSCRDLIILRGEVFPDDEGKLGSVEAYSFRPVLPGQSEIGRHPDVCLKRHGHPVQGPCWQIAVAQVGDLPRIDFLQGLLIKMERCFARGNGDLSSASVDDERVPRANRQHDVQDPRHRWNAHGACKQGSVGSGSAPFRDDAPSPFRLELDDEGWRNAASHDDLVAQIGW